MAEDEVRAEGAHLFVEARSGDKVVVAARGQRPETVARQAVGQHTVGMTQAQGAVTLGAQGLMIAQSHRLDAAAALGQHDVENANVHPG